jgi:hypothetical protein
VKVVLAGQQPQRLIHLILSQAYRAAGIFCWYRWCGGGTGAVNVGLGGARCVACILYDRNLVDLSLGGSLSGGRLTAQVKDIKDDDEAGQT